MAPPRRRAHDRSREPGRTRATHPPTLPTRKIIPFRCGSAAIYDLSRRRTFFAIGSLSAAWPPKTRTRRRYSHLPLRSRARFAIAFRAKSGRLLADSARARLSNRYVSCLPPLWAIFISAFIAKRGRYAILLIRFPIRPILASGAPVIEPRRDNARVRRAIKRRRANDRGRKRNNLVRAPDRQPSMLPREDRSNRSPLRLRTFPPWSEIQNQRIDWVTRPIVSFNRVNFGNVSAVCILSVGLNSTAPTGRRRGQYAANLASVCIFSIDYFKNE